MDNLHFPAAANETGVNVSMEYLSHRFSWSVEVALAVLLGVWPARAATGGDVCAYVANAGADYVSVIDVATQSVVATIDANGPPRAVAVDPAGQFIYVLAGEHLSFIDSSTYTPVRRVQVSTCPNSIALSADGQLAYVVDGCSDFISVVDLVSGHVVQSIRVKLAVENLFGGSLRVAISRDGTRLYVPQPWERFGSVAVIDVATGITIDTITFRPDLELPMATAVILSPDDQRAYVLLSYGFGAIPILDTETQTLVGDLQAPPPVYGLSAMATTPDGRMLYVADGGRRLHAIDTATNAIRTFDVGAGGAALAVTPDGSTIYSASNAGSVAILNAATGALSAQISVGAYPRDIAVGRVAGPCQPPGHTPRPTDTPVPTLTPTPTKALTPECPGGVPCLQVGSTSGSAGGAATITVRLSTSGLPISAVQNDILFDPRTRLGNCERGEGIHGYGRTFSYWSAAMRALLKSDDGDPFEDGTTLYTCTVHIAEGVPAGSYPLLATMVVGSDPEGRRIDVAAADGSIVVPETSDDSLHAEETGPSASDGGGGCHVIAGGADPAGTTLLATAGLLLWGRTKRRRVD
jgi:YVTN family beta-propeller protein